MTLTYQRRNELQQRPTHCAKCERAIAADELVVRVYVSETRASSRWLAPYCADCCNEGWLKVPQEAIRPCKGCGRPTAYEKHFWGVRRGWTVDKDYADSWWACGKACADRARRLVEQHQRACALRSCERTFTPARKDARYCSGACRQEAYRRRKQNPWSRHVKR